MHPCIGIPSALPTPPAWCKQKKALDPVDLKNAYGMESQLNDFRSKCRDENLEAVNTGVYNYRLGTFYNDFIGECERIGDYVINVVQAENEARQPVE